MMQDIEINRRFSRRALLGWLVSIGGASGLLMLIGSFGLSGLFSRTKAERLLKHDRAKRARQRRNERLKWAARDTRMFLIETHDPSKQVQTSVVHWPHPAFSRRLLLRRGAPVLVLKEIATRVRPRCAEQASLVRRGTTHFYPPLESAMRENLALAMLTFTPDKKLEGTDAALQMLEPLFDDDRQRCNWRIYYLYGRLTCWIEPDPKVAYERVLKSVWKRHDPPPGELAFLSSKDRFVRWHKKSRNQFTAKGLCKRIDVAKALTRGLSSNGQDTAAAETHRSNRSRPLSPSQARTRKLKLSRRKENRKAKRGHFVDQAAILWHKLLRKLDLHTTRRDGMPPAAAEPGLPRAILQAGMRSRSRHVCRVRPRNLPAIPSRRRLRRPPQPVRLRPAREDQVLLPVR